MKEKMDTLSVEPFQENNLEHYTFRRAMSESEDIAYISRRFLQYLKESEDENHISYMVFHEDTLIGYLKVNKEALRKQMVFEYAIHPEYRKKQYATILLNEATKHFLDQNPNYEKIKLAIHHYNYASIKVAQKNGYQREKREDENEIYSYHRR